MRILFLIGSLRMGGAERVVSRLANYWAENGKEVCVATIREEDSDFYQLDHRVHRVAFNLGYYARRRHQYYLKYTRTIFATAKVIRQFKPDVVISFVTGMNLRALAVKPFFSMPFIISERTNPDKQKINARFRQVRRLTYGYADKVVFVSKGVMNAYPWLPEQKKAVIYNPAISLPPAEANRSAEKSIVTLGRLHPVKGHDLLIQAFELIGDLHPDWSLRIFGEGDFRQQLEQQIEKSPLRGRIILEGFTRNPEMSLRSAGIFVLSSRHEGFPNALVEAMSMGLPCISFDCPYGPAELITQGKNGLLVPPGDVSALATAMDTMIKDAGARSAMAAEATSVSKRLEIGAIAREWEELVRTLIAEKK